MKKMGLIVLLILAVIGICYFPYVNTTYTCEIVSYTENGSYIEHPIIINLKDVDTQDKINKLLCDQVFYGAKDYNNNSFVDFTYLNYHFDFSSGIGITNEDFASFWYNFTGTGEEILEDGGVMRDTYRHYGITIDMRTGEKIKLSDFMEVDERLISSNNGNLEDYDYNNPVNLPYNKFKDAFMVYTDEDEMDSFHVFSADSIIERLLSDESETNWYIDENKNIVFTFNRNYIKIPYTEISNLIYPKYLEVLDGK